MKNFEFDLTLHLASFERKDLKEKISFKKGVYYWFASYSALKKMNIDSASEKLHKHLINGQEYCLVYIGIGPRNDQTKKQFIEQRIVNCHLGKMIKDSTFRLSVATLLGEKGCIGKNSKCYLLEEREIELSKFIVKEFCVCLTKNEKPWENESNLINCLQPPLNLHHNKNGWNYETMKRKREEFLKSCKEPSTPNPVGVILL